MNDTILILDFGSQVTQLIARRVREAGVYCEIHPFNRGDTAIKQLDPSGIILSGGPSSVVGGEGPRAPKLIFELGIPVLGICYGQQVMCAQLGGSVERSERRECGRASLRITDDCKLFDGLWHVGDQKQVWMSHGDSVIQLPDGFRAVGVSANAPFAVIADDYRRFYGVQFHPEVVHTPEGAELLRCFALRIAECSGNWTMEAYRKQAVEQIRDQVGQKKVICGLSGGVDSSVTALLIHEAIGDQLQCVFVDTGLLREDEAEDVVSVFREHYNIPLIHRDAGDEFLRKLEGVEDPEEKRKVIGATFIDVFEKEAQAIGGANFLAQGTLYPDVIESISFTGGPSVTIKSHHNTRTF